MRLMIWCLAVLATALRAPRLWVQPRFWAEEGTIFFARAHELSFLEMLGQAHFPYFTLLPVLGTEFGDSVLGMEAAPLATQILALGVQAALLAVVAFSRSPLLKATWVRATLCAFLVLAPTSCDVWLNTINAQFHLALASALLLTEEPQAVRGVAGRWGRRFLLALGGLEGVLAASLAPLFALRAWRSRDREARIQAAICLGMLAVQVVWLLGAGATRGAGLMERLASRTPLSFLAETWIYHFVAPLGGREAALAVWDLQGDPAIGFALRAGLLLGGGGLVGAFLLGWRRLPGAGWALAAYALLVVEVVLLGLGVGAPRYAHATSGLLLLLLLSGLDRAAAAPSWRRWLTLALVLSLTVGTIGTAWRHRRSLGHGPLWREEVAAWREDPRRPLAVHPTGWSFLLGGEAATAAAMPAAVEELGEGWSLGGGAPPVLGADLPVLGRPFRLRLEGPPHGRAKLAYDFGPLPPSVVEPIPGARLHVSPAHLSWWDVTLDEHGRWEFETELPAIPVLRGLRYRVQVVLLAPELALSNALKITLGDAP